MRDLKGQKFGKWTVLYRKKGRLLENDDGTYRLFRSKWVCSCTCGAIKEIRSNNLTSGKSKSCRKCAQKAYKSLIPKRPTKRPVLSVGGSVSQE